MKYVSETEAAPGGEKIKAYWTPGCSSCLRMKEFLRRNNVEYEAINVMESPDELAKLMRYGIRSVPIVIRGDRWAHGAILDDVAKVAGIAKRKADILRPQELAHRVDRFLTVTAGLTSRLTPDLFELNLPGQFRTYRYIACHISQIPMIWLDMIENGIQMTPESYDPKQFAHARTREDVGDYIAANQERFRAWARFGVGKVDYAARANLKIGSQTLHEFFERICWHSGQHTRQLQQALEARHLDLPDRITAADIAGLPLPEQIYEEEPEQHA